MDPTEDEAEQRHFVDVVRSFLLYESFMKLEIRRRMTHLHALSAEHKTLLPEVSVRKLQMVAQCVSKNQRLLREIVTSSDLGFNVDLGADGLYGGPPISAYQMHRLEAVLHSLVREWSAEGAEERRQSFEALLDELEVRLPVTNENRWKQRILVPGCGLGRLLLETAARGYSCQGNEFSYYMLIASNYMLNVAQQREALEFCPFVEQVSNVRQAEDTCRTLRIPDITAQSLLQAGERYTTKYGHNTPDELLVDNGEVVDFSMAAGDLLDVYRGQTNSWDGILTCFFIDTAAVVLQYIDLFFDILKPGGVWVNIGPLLYHWVSSASGDADERYDRSVELSWEEIRHAMLQKGFLIVEEEWRRCHYTRNVRSMMYTEYDCIFFTAVKPPASCET